MLMEGKQGTALKIFLDMIMSLYYAYCMAKKRKIRMNITLDEKLLNEFTEVIEPGARSAKIEDFIREYLFARECARNVGNQGLFYGRRKEDKKSS